MDALLENTTGLAVRGDQRRADAGSGYGAPARGVEPASSRDVADHGDGCARGDQLAPFGTFERGDGGLAESRDRGAAIPVSFFIPGR